MALVLLYSPLMKYRGLLILILALILSFGLGRIAGKRTMVSIEASFSEILQNLKVVEEIELMNQINLGEKRPKSLFSDPNL